MIQTLTKNILNKKTILNHFNTIHILTPNHQTTHTHHESHDHDTQLTHQHLTNNNTKIIKYLLTIKTIDKYNKFISIINNKITNHNNLFHIITIITIKIMNILIKTKFNTQKKPQIIIKLTLHTNKTNETNNHENNKHTKIYNQLTAHEFLTLTETQ